MEDPSQYNQPYGAPQKNIYYLIHKRYIIRYLMKTRVHPHTDTRKVNWSYFIYSGKISHFIQAHSHKITIEEINENKSYLLKVIKNAILLASQANPKSMLLKTTLAFFYIKYEKILPAS